MALAAEVVEWLTTAEHWRGSTGVPHRLVEHVVMSTAATVAAVAVAVPLGVALGHGGGRRSLGALAVNVSNIGRAIPSYGILVLCALAFGLSGPGGFGARPAFIALVALAIPPMVTNSYVGVRDVDADVREAARGMGMTSAQLLRRVELPLALPLVMAGVRTSAVQVMATATLAALTAWGGLGRLIVDGFARQDDAQIVAGALLVGALALLTEGALAAVQRLATRTRPGRDLPPEAAGPAPVSVGLP